MALRLTQSFPQQQKYRLRNSGALKIYSFIACFFQKSYLNEFLKELPPPPSPPEPYQFISSLCSQTWSATDCGLLLSSSAGPSLPWSGPPLCLVGLSLRVIKEESPNRVLLLAGVVTDLEVFCSLLRMGEVVELSSLSRVAGRNQSAHDKGGMEGESSLSSMLASIPSSWSIVALTWSTYIQSGPGFPIAFDAQPPASSRTHNIKCLCKHGGSNISFWFYMQYLLYYIYVSSDTSAKYTTIFNTPCSSPKELFFFPNQIIVKEIFLLSCYLS